MDVPRPDQAFWRNQLDVDVDLERKRLADPEARLDWAGSLGPRLRDILLETLGIEARDALSETRETLADLGDALLPFVFADAAMKNKYRSVLEEVAEQQLDEGALFRSRTSTDRYDRRALIWRLFLADPDNLLTVHHHDCIERRGFARMVLAEEVEDPKSESAASVFTKPHVQRLLDRYEADHNTLRQAHCAEVLPTESRLQILIKRDMKPDFVSHGEENVFGYQPEWIVLSFELDLRRVFISSTSATEPARIAGYLASTWFGDRVGYRNESDLTEEKHVRRFIEDAANPPNGRLLPVPLGLVELDLANSPFHGGTPLKLHHDEAEPVRTAIEQMRELLGDPLEDLDSIRSIKVLFADKRIKVKFERPEGKDESGLVVRYADSTLRLRERSAFETRLWRDYQIRALSTEKRNGA